jgi:hypothetical protein
MESWKLLLLALVSIAGAWLSARMEAREYAHNRKVSHFLLTILRLMVAGLVLRSLLPDPVELPVAALSLIYMMGIFGPVHRICLNQIRINRYFLHIPWHHLGTESKYDSLFRTLLRGNEKAAFVSMTTFEILIAAAMYNQLTP